jgi:signal transduction histidine kinase/FixJ family two-component response regulator
MSQTFPTAAEARRPRILVVDDEPQMRGFLSEALRESGYETETAEDGETAVERSRQVRFDAVLCDLKMPGMGGLNALERLKALDPDVEVIVITAHGTLENAIDSLRKGASDFLQKPIVLQDLLFSVGKVLERRDLRERVGLYELSRSIFSTLDPEELYGRITRSAIEVLRADDASLMLRDGEGGLRIALSTSLQQEVLVATQLALGERVAGRVALQPEPVVINEDVASDSRFAGVRPHRPIQAALVCPLTMRGELLGVLNVNRVKRSERYTEHDRRNAMVLSSLVALALGNARLHKELQARLLQIEQTTEESIQNEKMRSLGTLLSGVAHELNNPLCGVLGYAQLLQQSTTDSKMDKGIAVILKEAERASRIVANLLTFARRERAEKKPLGLNGVILKTVERKAYDLKLARIEVQADLDPKLPLVLGDFHQLQLVLSHLITNAQQAMFETSGHGTLTIRTEAREGRVLVTLADDGPGIPPENARRVFDPFFTTREVGKGIGLGLSVCYAIVGDHGGVIKLAEGKGTGATFVIELPAAATTATAAGETRTAAGPAAPGLRVLVADPEAHVQDLLVDLLGGMGYRVDTADNGDGALAKIRAGQYDALIADWALGRLDGARLLEVLRAERPDLSRRVIFLASDTASPRLIEFASNSGSLVLGKPFDLETLRSALRRVFSILPGETQSVH